MNADQMAKLREPFPAAVIGKLPRVTCRKCSDSSSKNCDQHSKVKCNICGNYMTAAHIHLDYVGHAAVTDRLLEVDPEWSWEPAAKDPQTGMPIAANGGLWIRLTIAGVTRYGWGDGGDPKVMIGDAIRNAAMRFGVALDLWSKQDLSDSQDSQDPPRGSPPAGVDAETGEVAPNLGRCCVCSKPIKPGEKIKPEAGGQRRHEDCVMEEPF